MPQPSKIEHHPQRAAIEAALFAGNEPLDALAETFNVSRDALHRWRKRNRPTASDTDAAVTEPTTEPESKRLFRKIQDAAVVERDAEIRKRRLGVAFEQAAGRMDLADMERLRDERKAAEQGHLKNLFDLKSLQVEYLDTRLRELDDEAQTCRDIAKKVKTDIAGRGWLGETQRFKLDYELGGVQARSRVIEIEHETRDLRERKSRVEGERDEIRRVLLRTFN